MLQSETHTLGHTKNVRESETHNIIHIYIHTHTLSGGLHLSPSRVVIRGPLRQVKKEGSTVRPLFMDPADLVSAWQKASERNPDMPKKPPVKVRLRAMKCYLTF